ncbi:MAG: helix-turn-helix domain-containing protein [Acidimicrobiales bacterium]
MPIDDPSTPLVRPPAKTSADRQDLLRTSDVAALFQVSTRTVSEWARRGRLPCMRTPGGQWRYPADAIQRLVRLAERGAWEADASLRPSNGSRPPGGHIP